MYSLCNRENNKKLFLNWFTFFPIWECKQNVDSIITVYVLFSTIFIISGNEYSFIEWKNSINSLPFTIGKKESIWIKVSSLNTLLICFIIFLACFSFNFGLFNKAWFMLNIISSCTWEKSIVLEKASLAFNKYFNFSFKYFSIKAPSFTFKSFCSKLSDFNSTW